MPNKDQYTKAIALAKQEQNLQEGEMEALLRQPLMDYPIIKYKLVENQKPFLEIEGEKYNKPLEPVMVEPKEADANQDFEVQVMDHVFYILQISVLTCLCLTSIHMSDNESN